LASDDYLDLCSIKEAVTFMDKNITYSACGFSGIFELDSHKKINDRQSKHLDQTIYNRIFNACILPGANSIFYSVKRRGIYEECLNLKYDRSLLGADHIETIYFLIKGPIKVLEKNLYRQLGGSGYPEQVRAKFRSQFIFKYIPKPKFLFIIFKMIDIKLKLICIIPLILWWFRLIIAPIRHYFHEKKY
jgi:hypothetical protein